MSSDNSPPQSPKSQGHTLDRQMSKIADDEELTDSRFVRCLVAQPCLSLFLFSMIAALCTQIALAGCWVGEGFNSTYACEGHGFECTFAHHGVATRPVSPIAVLTATPRASIAVPALRCVPG